MHKLAIAIIIIAGTQLFSQVQLENAFPNLKFTNPVDFQAPNDSSGRIFIVEQPGRIKVFQNSSTTSTAKTFLDITDRVVFGGEKGLLGLAFHPDFKNNGLFYVDYTTDSPALTSRISAFKISNSNPDSADKNSEQILLTQLQPFENHNGGQIRFGPDGYLYIAFGDGGNAGDPNNNAQNKTTFLGKILRIDVNNPSSGKNYSIPQDNPFANNTSGYKEEIYSVGMRNPWRFSFDHVTGWLWCGDVGQDNWEEIDLITKGRNYGWRCYEGTHIYNSTNCNDVYTNPIFEYEHTNGRCSITGGFVYRGNAVPQLYSRYIYADYCSKQFWALQYDSVNGVINDTLFTTSAGSPVAFGADAANELYVCSYDGNIYKFISANTAAENKTPGSFSYRLDQNYPNPFNPLTEIKYTIASPGFVTLKVYDLLGNEVKTLINQYKEKGNYTVIMQTEGLSSGIYFYELKSAGFVQTRKMVILK